MPRPIANIDQAEAWDGGEGDFDAVISRFGAMFFCDTVAAFRDLHGALRRGGRMVLITWRPLEHNPWMRAVRDVFAGECALPDRPAGTPGPFGLADPGAVRRLLTRAGFESIGFEEVNESVWLGPDIERAFAFVRGRQMVQDALRELDERAGRRVLDRLRGLLAAHASPSGVSMDASAWIITARRE